MASCLILTSHRQSHAHLSTHIRIIFTKYVYFRATLACNIPDYTRYARSANGQFIQLPFLPIIFTVCGVLGIVTTSASKVFSGQYLWNPLDIITLWLEYGSGGRCAAFFAALAWYVAQVGTNITANSISAANDLTVLFPRWINIKRGCMVAAVIAGWVLVPWKILSSAKTFLAFMGGYSGTCSRRSRKTCGLASEHRMMLFFLFFFFF